MKLTAFIICLLLTSTTGLAKHSLQSFTADYRLLLNGEHVGDARFSLKLTEDDQYSFEALTLPAGKMTVDDTPHEVLEASSGKLLGDIPVPEYYYTAVRTAEGTAILEFFYDWQAMTVTRKNGNDQRKSQLQKQSQDKLSYLLSAMKLAEAHKNSIVVPLLTESDAQRVSIRKKRHRHIDTAVGRILALELKISYGTKSPDRSLWLSMDHNYLPVLLKQKTDKGMVSMELVQFLYSSEAGG